MVSGFFSPTHSSYSHHEGFEDAVTLKAGRSSHDLLRNANRRRHRDLSLERYQQPHHRDRSVERQGPPNSLRIFVPDKSTSAAPPPPPANKSRSSTPTTPSDRRTPKSPGLSRAHSESRDEMPSTRRRRDRSRTRSLFSPSSSAASVDSTRSDGSRSRSRSKSRSSKQSKDEAIIQKLLTEGLWSSEPKQIEEVLNQVSNLMFTADEALKKFRRDAIYRAGGHLAIVQAMKRHSTGHKGVATQGCRALANSTWETSEFMTAITAVGGVDVILDCMKHFPEDEVVQICGSCALRNLSSMKKIAKMMVEKNSLPVVVAAMQTFPMNANIQECGCWTIAHFCLDRDNRKYLQAVKCFRWVGAAADNHSKQGEVLLAARQASERLWELVLQ